MELLELTAVVRAGTHGHVASCPELNLEASAISVNAALARLKEIVAEHLARTGGAPAYFTRYEMA